MSNEQMTTAEMKKLILECCDTSREYQLAEFKDYLRVHNGKSYTTGQFAGSIKQLVEAGFLENVARGVYLPKDHAGIKKEGQKEKSVFLEQVADCFSNTQKELEQIMGQIDILGLSDHEFRMLGEIKAFHDKMDEFVKNCRSRN